MQDIIAELKEAVDNLYRCAVSNSTAMSPDYYYAIANGAINQLIKSIENKSVNSNEQKSKGNKNRKVAKEKT